MIKLSFTDNGASIKKEVEDIKKLAEDIDKKGLNKDLKAGIDALLNSKEAADLKAYNVKFQKTPMG